MSRYTRAVPGQQAARLKNWGPGRLNQLKLFIGHLEQAINNSLAAQVKQSTKKKFSDFIPIIPGQDISGEIEFREIRITFDPPLGLKGLLYYEYQLSETVQFSQLESFTSPESSFVFGDLEDGSSYYIRIRIITKKGFVGPWSDTFQGDTPEAKAQSTLDPSETTTTITSNNFVDVRTEAYTALGGNIYYSIQYEITAVDDNTDKDKTTYWADVEFRWEVDGAQVGQNMLVTVYSGTTISVGQAPRNGALSDSGVLHAITGEFGGVLDITDVNKRLTVPGPFSVIRRGTLVQKFSLMTAGVREIKLLARVLPSTVHPTPNDYTFSTAVAIDYTKGVDMKLKHFNIFETIVEA